MSLLNVTKDIRKLAEEAERNKEELATAGLGLSGFVASQTGGSNRNPSKPTNLTIQANEAQAKANRVKADKKFNNLGNLNTSTQVNIPDSKIEKKPFSKPTFTTEPKVDTRVNPNDPLPNTGKKTRVRPEPTGFRGNLIKTAEGTVDIAKNVGKNLKNIGPKVGKLGGFGIGQLVEEYTGLDEAIAGAVNIDQGMQDYFSEVGRDKSRRTGLHKLGDATYDLYNFGTKLAGDILEFPFQAVGAGYDALMKQPGEANLNPFTRTFKGETYEEFFDDVSASGAGMYARRPNPEMSGDVKSTEDVLPESPAIPLSDRSDLEKQIIRNQQGGQPLLAGTFENQETNQAFGGEGVTDSQQLTDKKSENIPSYQSAFLERIQKEEPITDREFQGAQQFALKRGMVFDPQEGYSKAEFFGQMYKGQTIGQFLRGEDAPEGFTDVIPQFEPGKTSSREAEPEFVDGVRRITKREIGGSREMIEDKFGNISDASIPQRITELMLKPAGQRTDKENKRLASWANSTQGRGMGGLSAVKKQIEGEQEMTPYQKESLRMRQQGDKESLRRYEEGKQFNLEKFNESKRQYKEGVEQGLEADQLSNMYKKVQILGLMNNLIPEQDELGFDLDPNVINDYVGVLEEFGVEYDPETQVYKRKGKFGFGKQLNKEELSELSPLLKETKFVKLLEYTSKNNQ